MLLLVSHVLTGAGSIQWCGKIRAVYPLITVKEVQK